MDWPEALEIVIGRTGHEPYRRLCADEHPDHEAHRRRMIEKATGIAPTPATYPGLFRQAANLAAAAGRVVAAVATGGPIRVTAEVLEQRTAICLGCEFHDPARARCTKCGCGGAKLHLATERCPLDPPRWERTTDGNP